MMRPLSIRDFTYNLPQERIALYPLAKRDESRLLVYKHGDIEHLQFNNIIENLPDKSLLVFNNTKVIPARLHFIKDTGASIEIFLLHPLMPSTLLVEAMHAKGTCIWQCAIGNLKKWSEGLVLSKSLGDIVLEASIKDRDRGWVEFRWNGNDTFAEVVTLSGETPLPPYLKRAAESSDRERYQTVYAHHEGAVAAPTAGLHFTPEILDEAARRHIHTDFVTLHVSAGTFQPVKAENAADHAMHEEQIILTKQTIEHLIDTDRPLIPVGTTAMRTLESLYWYGVKLSRDADSSFRIMQNDPYEMTGDLSRTASLQHVLNAMHKINCDEITGETSIFIMPGYKFRMCDGLITNFHQPGSTLILLVAAFVGDDWKKIYNVALDNGYRFLSYGDSSLLLPNV